MNAIFPIRRRGFTLVELLVMIALVALLLSLLLPGIRSVRDRGLTAGCASNLRQIGVAASMWASEWNGRLPPHEISDVAQDYALQELGRRAQTWTDYAILGQYLGNDIEQSPGLVRKSSALHCPADRQDYPGWSRSRDDPALDASSYGLNVYLQRDPGADYRHGWGTQVTLRNIKTGIGMFNGSRTILAIDAHYPKWNAGSSSDTPPAYGAPEPLTGNWTPGSPTHWETWAMRHGNRRGANIVFIDGSVAYIEDDLATKLADQTYLFKKLNDYQNLQ